MKLTDMVILIHIIGYKYYEDNHLLRISPIRARNVTNDGHKKQIDLEIYVDTGRKFFHLFVFIYCSLSMLIRLTLFNQKQNNYDLDWDRQFIILVQSKQL